MPVQRGGLFFCLVGCSFLYASLAEIETKRFTAYTAPLPLLQGEVTNTFHHLSIPPGPIAIYRFKADVVEKDQDGHFMSVPIYDAYLHHHVVGSGHEHYKHSQSRLTPMKPKNFTRGIGFGAGTESRGTPQEFYFPYAFLTVQGENELVANVHVINTRNIPVEDAHTCLECPCTSEDVFTNHSVNGMEFSVTGCNAHLKYEDNTACSALTYYGGLRCCEHGEFCLERNQLKKEIKSVYYLRYTIEYSEVVPENRPLYLAGCCDATGDLNHFGNIEYDIPPCHPEIHPGCVHTLATRQRIDFQGNSVYDFANSNKQESTDREIELVYAVGHQHRAGMGIHLYNDQTGKLLCTSMPKYGTGNAAGNETGYIVAMSTCTFNPPIRMRSSDIVRVVSLYNNTLPHTGVMSLMYIAIADVPKEAEALNLNAKSIQLWFNPSNFAIVCICVAIFSLLGVFAAKKVRQRAGYSKMNENKSVDKTTPSQ